MGGRTGIPQGIPEYFTHKGADFISIDYRLAPETLLPDIVTDVEDAWDWVHENASDMGIDSTRIAVMGASAGGYLALAGGYRFNPKPSAVVSFYGYGDLTGDWYSEPSEYYLTEYEEILEAAAREVVGDTAVSDAPFPTARRTFYLYTRQQGIWPNAVTGRDPSERSWFASFEPLRNIDEAYPPTILLHGNNDTDVPFEQSVLLSQALAANGVPHEFLSNEVWPHAFDFIGTLADEGVADAYQKVWEFVSSGWERE